jgi:ABC-type lipoprotein export system ATPase subunit
MVEMNRRRGATLVLVTHDHELASRADRRISLRAGRVAADDDLRTEQSERNLSDEELEAARS